MAIPHWLWPTDGDRQAASLDRTEVEAVSDVLDTLSHPVRLEVLDALDGRADPMSYTELRRAVSIDDNGKLNYHLRRLDDLVASADGEYALNDRGERVVRAVVPDDDPRLGE